MSLRHRIIVAVLEIIDTARFICVSMKPANRLALGRLHVWRDSSDWAVEKAAETYLLYVDYPEHFKQDDFSFRLLHEGHKEFMLRLSTRSNALKAEIEKLRESIEATDKAIEEEKRRGSS